MRPSHPNKGGLRVLSSRPIRLLILCAAAIAALIALLLHRQPILLELAKDSIYGDYRYRMLNRTELSVALPGIHQLEVLVPERGTYAAGMLLTTHEQTDRFDRMAPLPFGVRLSVSSRETSDTIRRPISLFRRETGSGFLLTAFEAPRDIPVNRPFLLTVEVVGGDPRFEAKYGPVSFFLVRLSDK